MEAENNHYGLAVAITLVVIVLFFGGWYIFIGQALSGPTGADSITPKISDSNSPIVYGTSTDEVIGDSVIETETLD